MDRAHAFKCGADILVCGFWQLFSRQFEPRIARNVRTVRLE